MPAFSLSLFAQIAAGRGCEALLKGDAVEEAWGLRLLHGARKKGVGLLLRNHRAHAQQPGLVLESFPGR